MSENSREYEDFASVVLYKFGIPINNFSSKKYNIKIGESLAGVEIKNDSNCSKTGNLYIEFAEKDMDGNWVQSGIDRQDNSKFWFIGNYEKAYFFVKEQLKWFIEKYKSKLKKMENKTSKGYLIPIKEIEKFPVPLIIKEFNFTKENEVK